MEKKAFIRESIHTIRHFVDVVKNYRAKSVPLPKKLWFGRPRLYFSSLILGSVAYLVFSVHGAEAFWELCANNSFFYGFFFMPNFFIELFLHPGAIAAMACAFPLRKLLQEKPELGDEKPLHYFERIMVAPVLALVFIGIIQSVYSQVAHFPGQLALWEQIAHFVVGTIRGTIYYSTMSLLVMTALIFLSAGKAFGHVLAGFFKVKGPIFVLGMAAGIIDSFVFGLFFERKEEVNYSYSSLLEFKVAFPTSFETYLIEILVCVVVFGILWQGVCRSAVKLIKKEPEMLPAPDKDHRAPPPLPSEPST